MQGVSVLKVGHLNMCSLRWYWMLATAHVGRQEIETVEALRHSTARCQMLLVTVLNRFQRGPAGLMLVQVLLVCCPTSLCYSFIVSTLLANHNCIKFAELSHVEINFCIEEMMTRVIKLQLNNNYFIHYFNINLRLYIYIFFFSSTFLCTIKLRTDLWPFRRMLWGSHKLWKVDSLQREKWE